MSKKDVSSTVFRMDDFFTEVQIEVAGREFRGGVVTLAEQEKLSAAARNIATDADAYLDAIADVLNARRVEGDKKKKITGGDLKNYQDRQVHNLMLVLQGRPVVGLPGYQGDAEEEVEGKS